MLMLTSEPCLLLASVLTELTGCSSACSLPATFYFFIYLFFAIQEEINSRYKQELAFRVACMLLE